MPQLAGAGAACSHLRRIAVVTGASRSALFEALGLLEGCRSQTLPVHQPQARVASSAISMHEYSISRVTVGARSASVLFLIRREIPRLCWGGSRRSPFPEVDHSCLDGWDGYAEKRGAVLMLADESTANGLWRAAGRLV